jgi:predicted tellurium resistance membrane protein TerC
MSLADPFFWTALPKLIGVNIVLSGDNAIVIALCGALVIFRGAPLVKVMELFPLKKHQAR